MSTITNYELVEKAKVVLNRTDVYYKAPSLLERKKEFCYYNGVGLLVSPIGLIKAIIYNPSIVTNKVKKNYAMYKPSESFLDPTWSAYRCLTKGCTNQSSNFKEIAYGALLVMDSNNEDKCGIYIGQGQVIEVTNDWGKSTILTSKVDTSGNRYYNSVQSGQWKQWGKLKDIKYTYSPAENVEASANYEGDTTVITYTGNIVGTSSYSPSTLYNYMTYDGSELSNFELRPVYKALNLSTTVINSGNMYYIADKSGVCYNDSATINNRNIEKLSYLVYLTCTKAKALDSLTTSSGAKRSKLANCVGYARGRVFELWGQLLDHQIIVDSGSQLTVPTLNDLVISGDIYIPNKHTKGTAVPNTDGGNFFSKWPTVSGFGVGNEPRVGSLVCWGTKSYGHVAFVESVMNRGLSDEYIVVSESGWSVHGAKNIVWTKKVSKNNYLGTYSYGAGYTLKGFCYTPLCQIFEDTTTTSTSPIILSWDEVTSEDIEKMYETNQVLSDSRVTKELKIGDKVLVEWFGYKDPSSDKDDRSQRINISGAEGTIKKIETGKQFKYGVSTDGETVCGYFDRDALALLE